MAPKKKHFDEYLKAKKRDGLTLITYEEFCDVHQIPLSDRYEGHDMGTIKNIGEIIEGMSNEDIAEMQKNMRNEWYVPRGRSFWDIPSSWDIPRSQQYSSRHSFFHVVLAKPDLEWEHPKTRRLDKVTEGLRFLDPITQILWNATFEYPMCFLHRVNEDGTGKLDRIRLCQTKEEMISIKTRLEYVLKASGTNWRHWEQV